MIQVQNQNQAFSASEAAVVSGSAPPVNPVFWVPPSEIGTWTDVNGTFSGDLASFRAMADFQSLTSLGFVTGLGLTNITGLNLLPSVQVLQLDFQQLASIDVHGSVSLQTLTCAAQNDGAADTLVSLNVTGCSALTGLDAEANGNLPSLSLTGCGSLQALSLIGNTSMGVPDLSPCPGLLTLIADSLFPGSAVDLSVCSGIQVASFDFSNISSLNVTGCGALTFLDIAGATITSVDETQLTAIQNFNAAASALQSLNAPLWSGHIQSITVTFCSGLNPFLFSVSGCTLLTSLDISSSSVDQLDLTGMTVLDLLIVFGSAISDTHGLDISPCPLAVFFDAGSLPGLTSITGLTGNSTITQVFGNNSGFASIDISGCSSLINVQFRNTAMTNPTTIDNIFSNLDSFGLHGGNCGLDGGTNATPGPAGLTAAANLTGKGWTIAYNP